jgi:hypothetical protein
MGLIMNIATLKRVDVMNNISIHISTSPFIYS